MFGSFSLLLAAVFGWAAYAKWQDDTAFRSTLARLFPSAVAPVVSRLIPALELVLACALLFASPAYRPLVATSVIVLLLAFCGALAYMHVRQLPACGCFGEQADEPEHLTGILRNLLLLVVAVCIALYPAEASPFSGGPWLLLAHATIATGFVCLWSLVIGMVRFYTKISEGAANA
jgi:uncharacterized membrane protein